MRLIASSALAALLCACSQQTTVTPAEPAQATAPPASLPANPPLPARDSKAITSEGWGALRIGMTRAEVTAAVGETATPGAAGASEPGACDMFHPAKAPEGMYVMLQGDRLTSITLRKNTTLKTDRGFGVGDTAKAIKAAAGSAAQSMPHKYVEGAEYITVWTKGGPAAATGYTENPAARGVRYETDAAGLVTAVHAGGPSIQAVEGCS